MCIIVMRVIKQLERSVVISIQLYSFVFANMRSRALFLSTVTHRLVVARTMAIVKPPQQLLTPLEVEERLLMGPGPSNAHQRVLNACAQPILGHLDPRFCAIMDEVKVGLQYVWQTTNTHTFALSGTGHCGIEASIMNMTERGEKILICVNGIWGERASDMAERIGKSVSLYDLSRLQFLIFYVD